MTVALVGCGAPTASPPRAAVDPSTPPGARSLGTPTASSEAPAQPAVPARRAPSVVVPQAPVAARLPSGTVVAIRAVSTRADGELAVPADVDTAGWWRGGARLGDPFGSMLVAAHIDSRTQGLGPYAELLEARPGERVRIFSRGLVQDFAITRRRLVPQAPLTEEQSIFAPTGPARVTLVTCAPPYVRSEGGYQNLAVVTAVPVSQPKPRKSR